jgi:uncharacterized protein (TIGR03435 family)
MSWNGMMGGPGTNDPGRVTFRRSNLVALVTQAWDVKPYQVSGLDPTGGQDFDIDAKVPAGATKEQFRAMLRNLLAERFKLAIHHETKEMQGYELTAAKGGAKLKEAAPEPPNPGGPGALPAPVSMPTRITMGKDGYPEIPPGVAVTIFGSSRARWQLPHSGVAGLVSWLSGRLGKPVSDATGLTGKYDFSLYWSPDAGMRSSAASAAASDGAVAAAPPDSDAGPTLLMALQQQMGLKVEAKKVRVDVIVVDHAEKVPTEN